MFHLQPLVCSLPGLHGLCGGVSAQRAHGVLNHMGLDVTAALLLTFHWRVTGTDPDARGGGDGGVGLEHCGPEDHSPET